MAKRDIIINLVTKATGGGIKDTEKALDGLGKKSESTGGLFQKLGSRLSTLGDNVGKDLTGKFGAAGQAADKLGIATEGVAGVAGVAAGAVVGLGAAVFDGVGKLKELYDATRDFNEVAGTSWEEGSRLIAVFDDLRVSSDEGAKAMGYLSKTVGETPDKLKDFGVEVARTKDGTVDMAATLENAATAFQRTVDPAKRAALGNALFGRSWQNMVPVLNQGGDALKALVDGVDDSQVATAKGAEQQDKLFEATDNLHDAIDGLEREMAENLIPTLTELATLLTTVIGKGESLGHVIGEVSRLGGIGKTVAGALGDVADKFVHFGQASDHVAEATGRVIDVVGPLGTDVLGRAANALRDLNPEMATTKQRAKDAAEEYDKFKKKVDDLLQQQEDMRNAQLGAIGTSQALSDANEQAGDASMELTTKSKEVENAVRDYGEGSTEAAIATEEYHRAIRAAKEAATDAADAEVTHAAKMAESHGQTLTAAEQTQIYRDKLIDLRDGAKDPSLIAALQGYIDYLAETASQAQNAAANTHGLIQAMNDASGIERNFTGRDQSGAAVVRRASGGPVWPGRTYMVGENGPELLTLPKGPGFGEVLSPPQAAQEGTGWPSLSGVSGAYPTVTRNADGTVMFAGDPNTYPGSTVITPSQPKFPAVNVAVKTGAVKSIPGYPPATSGSGSPAGAGATIIVNFYGGYNNVKEIVEAIKRYEAGRK